MAQVHERTTSKPSACLKVILLLANDAATLRPLAHVLSQELHSHIFVASNNFAAVKFVSHITPLIWMSSLRPSKPSSLHFHPCEIITRFPVKKEEEVCGFIVKP